MENIGGALAFKATLDIDDFKVSSEAMGRYIKTLLIMPCWKQTAWSNRF